ncbi:MAG: flagellar basal body L-ring protein FlgH [Deltaproteobacteria bacterium]|nr:flagellar basal body L-ring protein FlgH [Deltaproteobacteria bacterium]MCB9787816.1 flagellar basal body L-ring protein FlgH [Deltaproteobacteria bacterium]
MRTPLPHALLFLAAIATGTSACKVSHIRGYTPKQRDYQSPVTFDDLDHATTPGSLFNPTHAVSFLATDHRAMRKGDIVTVRVSERADAQRGASTDLSRSSDTHMNISAFLGLMSKLGAILDNGNELLSLGSGSTFRGEGSTSRTEKLEATVPALVREVLPNGNLFIEGHRVVLVNSEEHHFYISGLIRPVDIQQDNSVASYLIADAEIEFTGRGVVTEKLDPPWLQRGLDFIRPF